MRNIAVSKYWYSRRKVPKGSGKFPTLPTRSRDRKRCSVFYVRVLFHFLLLRPSTQRPTHPTHFGSSPLDNSQEHCTRGGPGTRLVQTRAYYGWNVHFSRSRVKKVEFAAESISECQGARNNFPFLIAALMTRANDMHWWHAMLISEISALWRLLLLFLVAVYIYACGCWYIGVYWD